MGKNLNDSFLILYQFLAFMLIMVFFMIQHESVHQQIGMMHGADSCNVSYEWLKLKGQTDCSWPNTVDKAEYAQALELNSINEIVGYNLQTLIIALFAVAMLVVLANNEKPPKPPISPINPQNPVAMGVLLKSAVKTNANSLSLTAENLQKPSKTPLKPLVLQNPEPNEALLKSAVKTNANKREEW